MSIENSLDPAPRAAVSAPAPDERERRAQRRKPTLWEARLDCDAGAFSCFVLNIAVGGAMLQIDAPPIKAVRATLMIERFGALAARVVWQLPEARRLGLRFTDPPERVVRILGGAVSL